MKDINRKLFISKKQLQKLLEEFAVEEIAAQKKVHLSTVYAALRKHNLEPIFHSPLTPEERQNSLRKFKKSESNSRC